MQAPFANVRRGMERRFVLLFALACVVLAALPGLYARLATPPGMRYTGFQTNVDDHMVYAAWTWQAAHGALTFDDRFAVDPQPGLTFHLYFLLVGQVARLTGVVAAMALGRALFTFLFVLLLARLVRRLRPSLFGTKLAVASAVVAGGLGFLPSFWHRFGVTGPVDVWQPEGFVWPSMLTTGLFMVSLCLVLSVFLCVLGARRAGWRPVVLGALAMAALMNVHSYDALLVGLVLIGFLASLLVQRLATWPWTLRATLIVLGALPPALWFFHVLREDPVFAARAATKTYTPNFLQVLEGYLPPIVLAFVGLARRIPMGRGQGTGVRRLAGLALAAATILALALGSRDYVQVYFLSPAAWAGAFLAMVVATALLAECSPARNLVVSWALVGTVAIYFPGLFQRKLTMGLAIPWAILSALAVEGLIRDRERSSRNLVTTLALLVLGGSAFRWTFREIDFAKSNVASTARHPVYLGPDVQRILAYLADLPAGRHVVLAFPGAPETARDETGQPIPDAFVTPTIPDVAPFLTGLTGVYTVAGHWSETPDYSARANESARFFLAAPVGRTSPMTDGERRALVARWSVEYAVAPVADGLAKPESLGNVVVAGTQFALVKLPLGSP